MGGVECDLLLKTGLTLGSDQVAQGSVELGYEDLQRQRLHSLSGQPVLVVSYQHNNFLFHAAHHSKESVFWVNFSKAAVGSR